MAIRASRGFRRFPNTDTSSGSVDELTRNSQEAVKQVYASSEQFAPEPTCDTLEFIRSTWTTVRKSGWFSAST
jgi:hypothetical protein